MLAQKLDAHVHQLQRVERAAPELRAARGVGALPREAEDHLDVGQRAARPDAVVVPRMPGEDGVEPVKEAVAREEGLGAAGLLRRAAEVDDRARKQAGGDGLLDGDRRGQGADAQKVVPAAVARRARRHGLADGAAGLLAHGAQRIELAQEREDGPPAAVFGAEGVGHAVQAVRDGKAVLQQQRAQNARRGVLMKVDLGMLPNGVAGGGVGLGVRIDAGTDGVLQGSWIHRYFLLWRLPAGLQENNGLSIRK